MKSILILCFSKLQHDARVGRQIDFLKKTYRITAVVFDGLPDPDVELVKIERPKLGLFRKAFLSVFFILRIHSTAYRLLHGHPQLRRLLADRQFDLIIANDIEALPLAFDIDANAKVLFDAHEYAPRHFEDKLSWRIFFQPFNLSLCKKYIPKVKAMTTVGTGLANEYHKHFSVDPVIITNATAYHEIVSSPMKPNTIRMIHHGGATVSRKLELMIELMRHLEERFTLDLMLIVPELASSKTKNYINRLRTLADGDPRIRFLPPVKSLDIVAFINRYDMGLFLLPPVNFNYANTLPNKLFDFIQARLGVAIGPTPEMAEIVNSYKIGVVSKDFSPESLAFELNKLSSSDVEQFKLNASRPARERSAEANKIKLLELVDKIVSG
jgi:hypothetical protein